MGRTGYVLKLSAHKRISSKKEIESDEERERKRETVLIHFLQTPFPTSPLVVFSRFHDITFIVRMTDVL